jgi:hypothetical protein
MILLVYVQEAAKRHDGIGDLAGTLVDHDVVDLAQRVTSSVVDVRASDLGGGMTLAVSSSVSMFRPFNHG